MKRSIIYASMAIAAGLMLANTYTSIVDVPAWGNNIPHSMQTARQYYSVSNPGDFFRIFSPINQGLGLLCVVLFWKSGKDIRRLLLAAFLLYAAAEGLTFMYFYPRNAIMFSPGITDTEALTTTWQQWRSMNWFRTLLIAVGLVCSSAALHRTYVSVKNRDRSYTRSYAGEAAAIQQ